jgi:Protein of unknown function (DUF2911)
MMSRRRTLTLAIVTVAGGIAIGLLATRVHAGAGQEPRLSPHETDSATVDGAKISVTYGRPYMRGRKIFGGLVPFGEIWMPGADEATILQTDKALQFDGLTVPAGSYSIYTLPSEKNWQLIINRQTGQWHTEYDRSRDLGRVSMRVSAIAPAVEQLLIRALPEPDGGALELEWETTRALASFKVGK